MREAEVDLRPTFNVIFTAGSPRRLLPFALTLLKGGDARIRAVGNGLATDERKLLATATQVDERISHYELPQDHHVAHGVALNHLFEAFPEQTFAFIDSDVIASGNFMPGLWPPAANEAAVFAAPPAWMTGEEGVAPEGVRTLSGRHRRLRDGTVVGSTFCGIYDRAAVEPLWRAAPRGFEVHHDYMLPAALKAALAARGWRYRSFDTCRLVNLQLMLEGFELADRDVPELHHVGGMSGKAFHGVGGVGRTLVSTLRSSEPITLKRIADGIALRAYRRIQAAPSRRSRMTRKAALGDYVEEMLDAVAGGRQAPEAPQTGVREVDDRIVELRTVLETHYPPALAALKAAGASQP